MNWQWTSIDSIEKLSPTELSKLHAINNSPSPFLSYAFLQALELSGSVGGNSGWQPAHILVTDNDTLIAFLPAYLKTHSYGEYVFDHSWASAYQQHGISYYPKLSVCIPFTPVTGPRALMLDPSLMPKLAEFLCQNKALIMTELGISSIHCLFLDTAFSDILKHHGMHQRQSVQFNWHNQNYTCFDDFMSSLTARRRRSIRKERTGIAKQDTIAYRIVGENIQAHDMAFFYQCYQQTYLKRSGHTGYLNLKFFETLRSNMPENLMLVVAKKADINIACALFLFNDQGLYGRYWGALEDVSGLHFEACYYQGIEFCIERKIPLFNPGTQGEHKILRGFSPTLCYSNHSMQSVSFDNAIQDFLLRETPHIIEYHTHSASLLPYKETQSLDNKN